MYKHCTLFPMVLRHNTDKKKFWCFSNLLNNYKIYNSTWKFFEAGHGKGEADGIGGAVKRRADDLVKFGSNIAIGEILVMSRRLVATTWSSLLTKKMQSLLKKEQVLTVLAQPDMKIIGNRVYYLFNSAVNVLEKV